MLRESELLERAGSLPNTTADERPEGVPAAWDWGEIERNPCEPPQNVLGTIIQQGTHNGVQGEAKTRKTSFLKALEVELIKPDGRLFGPDGLAVNGGPYHVVHFGEEMPARPLVEQMWHRHGLIESPHRHRLTYLHCEGFRLNSDEGAERMVEAIRWHHRGDAVAGLPIFVGLDSFTKAEAAEDENTNAQRKLAHGRLQRVLGEFEATGLSIFHESYGQGRDTARGGKSTYEEVDTMLRLTRVAGTGFTLAVREARWFDKHDVQPMTVRADFDKSAGRFGRFTYTPMMPAGDEGADKQAEQELAVLIAIGDPRCSGTESALHEATGMSKRTCARTRNRLMAGPRFWVSKDGASYTLTAAGRAHLAEKTGQDDVQ